MTISHPVGPSTPAAAITAIDEKLTTADASESVSLPYWLVNVPPDQWPAECPDFLRDLPEKNVMILSTPDEYYKRQGWEEVQDIISPWLPPSPGSSPVNVPRFAEKYIRDQSH